MPHHQEISRRERVKLCPGVFLDMNTGFVTYTDRNGVPKVESLQSAMPKTGYRYLLFMIEHNGTPLSREEINLQAELNIEYIDRRVSDYKKELARFGGGILQELVKHLVSQKGMDTLILPAQEEFDSEPAAAAELGDLLARSRAFYEQTADKKLSSLMFSSCIVAKEGEKERKESSLPSALETLAREGCSAFVVSEGGSGKTSAFYELWRRLLDKPEELLPFYVNAVDTDEASASPIRSYLHRCYGADPFSLPNRFGRRIVLLLDGTNEVPVNDRLLQELSLLKKDGAVFTASRLESDWKKTGIPVLVRPGGVPEENIRTLLERLSVPFDRRNRKLLAVPFYLNAFVQLAADALESSSVQLSRLGLITSYLGYLTEKNRYYVKNISSDTLLALALDEILPQLCLEMNLDRRMRFSAGDLPSELDAETRVGVLSLLQHLGLIHMVQTKDRGRVYRMEHQIYLDYFAAKKMAENLQAAGAMSRRVRICSNAVLEFLAGFLLEQGSFYRKNGSIALSKSQAERIFQLKKGRLMQTRYENCSLLLYTLLDHLPNGSEKKTQFCLSAEELFAGIFRSAKELLSSGDLKPSEDVLEIPRLYSEVLRRNERYAQSIEVSSYLQQLAAPLSTENLRGYGMDAGTNIMKCKLYDAFSRAKKAAEGGRSEEIQKDYDLVLMGLKEMAAQAHNLSSSIYGSLMVYPDVVSLPYIEDYCRRAGIEDRRLEGFLSYMNCFRREYLRTGGDDAHFYYHYPLQKCIDCLMDNQVSRIPGRNDGKNFDVYEFAQVDTGSFCSYDPDRRRDSLALAGSLLSLMLKEDGRAAARELNHRFQIFSAAYREDGLSLDAVLRGALDSSGYPCSAFVYQVLQKEPDPMELEQLLKKLEKIAQARTPDSKDAIYHQRDMLRCWEILRPQIPPLSKEVQEKIDLLLHAELGCSL